MSTRDEYVEVLKSTLVSMIKKSLLKALISKLPFLAWGPIGPFVGLVVGKLAEIVVKETEVGLFCFFIDLRTNRQAGKFTEASIENWKIQQGGTDEEKKLAENKLIDSFREFVKLSN